MLKREWSAEINGKLPHLFIPSKTATLVRVLAVVDLPLDGTASLVPAFAVNTLIMMMTIKISELSYGAVYVFLLCRYEL